MSKLKAASELMWDLKKIGPSPEMACTYIRANSESFKAIDPLESVAASIVHKIYQAYRSLTILTALL